MAATDYSAFRTMFLNYVRVDGTTPYSTVDSSSNTDALAVANEVLGRFTEQTMCLFSDRITFTLSTSTPVYSLRDLTVFGQAIINVQRVYINKTPIFQVTEEDISRMFPSYLTDAAAKPSSWFTMPPEQIALNVTSDQVYTNSFVSGWYVHPILTAESGAGGTLFLRPEDMRVAAKEVAIAMLEPYALGTSRDRLDKLMAENEAAKVRIRGRSSQLYAGDETRRGSSSIVSLR